MAEVVFLVAATALLVLVLRPLVSWWVPVAVLAVVLLVAYGDVVRDAVTGPAGPETAMEVER